MPLSKYEFRPAQLRLMSERASFIVLHVEVKTSFADLKPYVREAPMGSQIRHRKKSSMIKPKENLKTLEYHRAERSIKISGAYLGMTGKDSQGR